jgi:hypothetical protein
MKNKILILSGLLMLLTVPVIPMAAGDYETSFPATAFDVDTRNRNFLTEHDQETWLIHYGLGCGILEEGAKVTLAAHGELDGNNDLLQADVYHSCVIDQAEIITGKLLVTRVSFSDTGTDVRDANDNPYYIYYSSDCRAVKGLEGKYLYLKQYGTQLQEGDLIFLPDNGPSCALTHVKPVQPLPEPKEEDASRDTKKPSTPSRFRAIPTSKAVYLYWEPATDNVGISHYLINASPYHTVDERVREPTELAQLDNVIVTPDNKPSLRLDYLEPDELYFFRIAAVDLSGNTSAYWSTEATAMTRSAIAEIDLRQTRLRIYQVQESSKSFLLRWNRVPEATRTSVVLEVDGERVFTSSDWQQYYLRVLKKPERKGKPLKLTVRAMNPDGRRTENEITFGF